ncbi:MAG: ABC transporter ATP-binding protein [Candidatus Odinarchaeia archaeon]
MGEKEVALEIINLSKYYGKGDIKIAALRNVTTKIYRGEPTCIMGPSGSGKTTLLNLIGLLDRPSEGKILLDGRDLTELSDKEVVNLRRHTLGFIFQFYNLIDVLTAIENVELPMVIAGVPKEKRIKKAKALLSLVGLSDRAHHLPDELSGGEQQRVAIARALANDPSLILADEPTGDLDSKTGHTIVDLLVKMCKERNITLIMVTHDAEMAKLTDRVLLIRDGTLVSEYRPKNTD